MNDQAIMENLLLTTKGVCDLYMHGTVESSTQNVHHAFDTALSDSLCMQDDIYKQIVCGSNCWCKPGIKHLMHYLKENKIEKGIKGFLLAPWARTYKESLMSIKEGIYLSKFARDDHEMFK